MLYGRTRGFDLRGTAAVLSVACGLLAANPADVRAVESGDSIAANIEMAEGKRTLRLEYLSDMALVRSGAGLPSQLRVVGGHSSGYVLIRSEDGANACELAASSGADFVGPVFRMGSRIVAAGDSVIVRFEPSISPETRKATLDACGLETVSDLGNGIVVARSSTGDGHDTVNAAIALNNSPAVLEAGVSWFSQL